MAISFAAGPSAPAVVSLRDSKGLDERRCARVLSAAQAAAREARRAARRSAAVLLWVGGAALRPCDKPKLPPPEQAFPGPQLLVSFEAAADMLTQLNHPDGDCTICLCPLEVRRGPAPASKRPNRPLPCSSVRSRWRLRGSPLPSPRAPFPCLPPPQLGARSELFFQLMSCYHCFHIACFARWWRSLPAHAPAAAAGAGARQASGASASTPGLRGEAPPLPGCPVCRVAIRKQDFAHVLQHLEAPRGDRGAPGSADGAGGSRGGGLAELAPEAREALRRQQEAFRAGFQKQARAHTHCSLLHGLSAGPAWSDSSSLRVL